MTRAVPTIFHEDGSETRLPIRWQICSQCEGHGKSSAHLGAFTRSELDDQGPDFVDDYMRGDYDITCDACDGTGKIAVADFSQMTKAQRAEYRGQCRADREIDAEHAVERRMGA